MPAPPRRPSECDWQSKFSPRRHGDTEKNKTSFTADERGWARIRSRSAANEEIAKIAIIAGIAKIEKPTPTPLKHGVSGVSGGMKIAVIHGRAPRLRRGRRDRSRGIARKRRDRKSKIHH